MQESENNANRLMALATGYWGAGAFNTAVTLGLFDLLKEAQPVSSLAESLKVDSSALSDLVNALVGLNVLELSQGLISIPKELEPWLLPDSRESLLDAMRYNADLFRLWGDLPRCVQTGQPVLPIAQLGADPSMTERFVRGMESRGRWLAPQLVPDLDVGNSGKMLDLACGSGIFSRTLLKHHPQLELSLFDLPSVLEWTRKLWDDAGMGLAAKYVEGDYREDDLPGQYDYILYAGALHQESAESAQKLFEKAKRSLSPGGVFCVVDIMLDEDRTKSVFANLFSLNMRLLQPDGHVFSVDEVAGLLSSSGYSSVEILPPARYPYRILNASM